MLRALLRPRGACVAAVDRLTRGAPAAACGAAPALGDALLLARFATDVEYVERSPPDAASLAAAAARAGAARQAGAETRFLSQPVATGARLAVDAGGAAVDVHIGVGELSAIAAEWPAAACPVTASCDESGVALAAGPGAAGPGAAGALRAWIPERFCSAHVTTGGAVSIDTIVEGAVSVRAGAGVALGRCRGGDVAVTCRGAVTARHVAAQTTVFSGGGSVTMERLVGRDVELNTGGGAVAIGTLYCDRLSVRSGGGDVRIRNLRVSERALVESGGGAIAVGGVDGTGTESTVLSSGGGAVAVQLNDRANALRVESGGGDVDLFVPEAFDRPVLVARGRAAARPTRPRAGRLRDRRRPARGGRDGGAADAAALPAARGAPPPPQRIYGGDTDGAALLVAAPPTGAVQVDARGGAVRVGRRAWMEMMLRAKEIVGAGVPAAAKADVS